MGDRSVERSPSSLASIEEIVHAGSWALKFSTSRCTWSAGLLALLDGEPGSLEPTIEALLALVHSDDRAGVTAAWRAAREEQTPFEVIHRVCLANGVTKIVLHRAITNYGGDGKPIDAVGILVDITNQQLTRKKLDDATATLMAVWEHVPEGLILVDAASGTVTDGNPFAERILQRDHAHLVGTHFTDLLAPERRTHGAALFANVDAEPVRNVESVVNNGPDVEVSTSGTFRVGEQVLTLASFRDISERRRYERSAARVTDAMAAMARANAAIVRAESAEHLLRNVCSAIIGGSVVAACVVVPQTGERQVVRLLASAGPARAYFDDLEAMWGMQGTDARSPFSTALRTQLPCAVHVSDPAFAGYRERAVAHGLFGCLALPVPDDESLPVFSIYVNEPDGFNSDEVALFSSLAMDIHLALRALRSRDRLQRAVDAERERAAEVGAALKGALAAVSATFEKRDPFTAGHEQRVADLTKFIAVECALDSESAEGLYLAATVHDIGKISVPSEILTRPGAFTTLEYEFVKLHAGTGHDILRDIAFPWDIAGMVHQHHEYLDGSGYPLGLRGRELSLSVRILTVADIVEAMSAFRPYHSAVALDIVLEKIISMGKKQLDPEVVAACVRVIERGEFKPAPTPDSTVELSA